MTDEISLADRIACVRREIALRERVYPKFVASGRMKQEAAERELETMRAVLTTVEAVAAGDDAKLADLHGQHHAAMIRTVTGRAAASD